MQLIEVGRYDEGIERLLEAYETLPHPNVLSNIGRAYALAGRLDEAIRYFELYRESGPPNEREIEEILDQLRAALAESATPEPPPEPEQAVAPATTAPASDAEREELLATAAEIEELARATHSEHLAERARALRALAESRAQPTTPVVTPETTPTEPAPESEHAVEARAEPPARGLAIDLASSVDESDTYAESIESASRSASSPLDAPASTTIITRQDIRLSGATSIAEVLRRAAGVSVMTPTPYASNVGIRGFNRLLSPRVLMLVNGRPTYIDALGEPFWDFQPFTVEDIERVEIIRGPASSLFGANGFSGVVNVVLRPVGGRTVNEASLGVGNGHTVRGHAAVTGRVGPVAYRLHAGYQQTDRFAVPFDSRRMDVEFPVDERALALRSSTAGVQIRAPLGDAATLSIEGGVGYLPRANFYATSAFLDFVGSYLVGYAMATVDGNLGRIRVFANHDVGDLSLVLSPIGATQLETDTVEAEADLHRRFHLVVDHDLHVGFNYRYKTADWNYLSPGTKRQHHIGLFFEDTMQAGDHVRLVASLRVDRHPLVDRLVFSPRGALLLQPNDERTVRFTAGTAFRSPSFQDAYMDIPVPTHITGAVAFARGGDVVGRRVRPEQIQSFEVGYLDQSSDRISFDVAAYYNRVSHLIGISPTTTPATLYDYVDANGFDEGYLRRFDAFVYGTAAMENEPFDYHVVGGELTVRANPIRGLDTTLAYSLNATRSVEHGGAATWDRRTSLHMLNLGVQYRSRVGVDVSSDFHVSSAQRWPELVVTESAIERVRLPIPAYFLLNTRIAYRFAEDRFEVALCAFNLTKTQRRQHPSGQPIDQRIMATIAVRVGDR